MPRIRTLKPEIFVSSQVMNLSRDARLLFIGLITQADDDGRGVADYRKLKATIFPGDDDITRNKIEKLLQQIRDQQLAILYDDGSGQNLYALPTWSKHQKISKPRPSTLPAPPSNSVTPSEPVSEHSDTTPGTMQEASNGKGSEGKGTDLIKDPGSESTTGEEPEGRHGDRTARTCGADRRNGEFEDINHAVRELIKSGACKPYDAIGIAKAANISEAQASASLKQLRDRGEFH